MILKKLPLLFQNMQENQIDTIMFHFDFRNLHFSVVYRATEFPHELLFGCTAENIFFTAKVNEDFQVTTYLGDAYNLLVKALNLKFDPQNTFKPAVLFEAFDDATPITIKGLKRPTIVDIARLRRDVEESDKIYFFKWQPHDGKRSKPSSQNLEKTKRICGLKTYEFCKKNHISSCWTDLAELAQKYYEPQT